VRVEAGRLSLLGFFVCDFALVAVRTDVKRRRHFELGVEALTARKHGENEARFVLSNLRHP
jgi:hypothetical protein